MKAEDRTLIERIEDNVNALLNLHKRRAWLFWLIILASIVILIHRFGVGTWLQRSTEETSTVISNSKQATSLIPEIKITEPDDNGLAIFKIGPGQGGTVTIRGQSKGINSNMAILLVTVASDEIERPQLIGAPAHPDGNGEWQSDIQVGDQNNLPKRDDKFLVKVFILGKMKYDELQQKSIAGALSWPTEETKLTPAASVSFQLAEKSIN